MRATERTYYSIKRLHLWMAVSSLTLLAVTVWMLIADHNRQWKQYQRTFQDRIRPWTSAVRILQEQDLESPDREEFGRILARQQPGLGRRLLRLPLLEALGRPLAVEQIWLPKLTIDYNFGQVARFDRCLTCHQGIDDSQPGRATQPAFRPEQRLTVQLATPGQAPEPTDDDQGQETPPSLERVYGLVLAEEGILDPRAATIVRVLPKTPAAFAKLMVGDVILKIDGKGPIDRAGVRRYLLDEVEWGRPLALEIGRGLPHPYSSHPRLDLLVGSSSPHPMAEFGCTICHDGQGSATEFKWASHTPDDPAQGDKWRGQYDWFPNPHWDLRMLPRRFAQSRCLKCHHEVTDLEGGRRWSDPPAEKLLAGYHLVRQYGCFGCHEINGFDQRGRSVGPDMRLEPSGATVERGLPPGTMRKVGPTLRDLAGRLDAVFLAGWIRNPTEFRPNTRMPRFYGLHEHLDGQALEQAERFEAVEIRAITEYLLAAGRPLEPQTAPPEVTEPPSAARGKRLFEIHGCLACHKHRDFPRGRATQGPDLSGLGSKYNTQSGRAWLADWIRDPARHSPRTLMPNPLLEPVPLDAASQDAGDPPPRVTDPAADIAAYLLDDTGWQPRGPAPLNEADLDELAFRYLSKRYGERLAVSYVKQGIPESMARQVRGDAIELLGEVTTEKKLRYVGRRTISRRGCYGCHDIPGFEAAQPIGPALTDWGRKQESLLAFEQIDQFVRSAVPADAKRTESADAKRPRNTRLAAAGTAAHDAAHDAGPDRAFFIDALGARRREGFIWQKLRAPRSFDFRVAAEKGYNEWLTMGRFNFTAAEREAIITFVLGLVADPPAERYVYHPDASRKAIAQGRKVLDKYACAGCHVLEMERWTFEYDPETFEAPPPFGAEHELLQPEIPAEQMFASLQRDNRGLGTAEVAGMPRVDADGELVIVDDDEDQEGQAIYQYSFTPWEPAVINGNLWRVGGADLLICGPEIADGRLAAGEVDLSDWGARLTAIRPPLGGALARLLLPVVLAEARESGGRPLGPEAWGWVPPPLVGEGAKVRPAWLHDYLLAPEPIRPACVLRMPRYNMSPAEADKLVDYFAAVSGVDFPYSSDPRGRTAHVLEQERRQPGRLDDAMKLLTASGTDCVKCHLIGDYSPGGETGSTLAPNLERVARRIRPEYLRRWLANPKTVLPYTRMTVNFPPEGPPLEPELFGGKTLEQLDAVMDLLLNYDWYLKRQTSIRQLVPRDNQ